MQSPRVVTGERAWAAFGDGRKIAAKKREDVIGGTVARVAARGLIRAQRSAIFAALLAVTPAMGSVGVRANAERAPVVFHIAAQPLSSALLEWGREAGISIALPNDFPRDLASPPLDGAFAPPRALAFLLKDAPVAFTFIDPETVAVGVRKPVENPSSPVEARPAPPGAADNGALEEVVVTARRREERMQSVPVAVSVFNAAQLRADNITSTQDLGLFAPSLVINNNAGFGPGFVLRGQGLSLGAGPGVVAYFAEVPFANGQNATGAFQGGTGAGIFYDMEDVQVLKGPQGTLFGRNTTGGAILFTPRKPANDFDGYGQVTAGSHGWREVEGAVNLPVVDDKLLLRLSTDIAMRNGYTRDVGPFFPGKDYDNRDYWAFRGAATFRPSDDFENYVVASSLYVHQNGVGGSIFAVKPGSLAADAFPSIFAYLALQRAMGPRETEESTAQIDKQWTYGVIDIARWDMTDDMIFRNIAGWLADKNSAGIIDFDNSPFPIQDLRAPNGWAGASEQFSEEPQFNGKSFHDRLRWTAGAYVEYDKPTDIPQYDVVAPVQAASDLYVPALVVAQGSTTQRTRAVYGQGAYDLEGLWPALAGVAFTGGYRYTWDYRSDASDIYIPTAADACAERPGFRVPRCLIGSSGRFHAPTWTLALDYQATPRTLVYVTGRRGYKSGGFNLNTPDHSAYNEFRPELVTDVEIGVKSDWDLLGVTARTDIDAFHADYTDIQRSVSVLINGLSSPVTENAAVATIDGVEAEGALIPRAGTEISFAYSYLAAKYDRYVSPTLGSLAGLQFPYTPKNKISATGRWHLPAPPAWGDVTLSATYLLQSAVNAGPDYSATDVIQGYGLVNLRLDWNRAMGSALDASLFVTNAADKVYVTRISSLYNVFGIAGASYGEPRMIGAQLRYRFGP